MIRFIRRVNGLVRLMMTENDLEKTLYLYLLVLVSLFLIPSGIEMLIVLPGFEYFGIMLFVFSAAFLFLIYVAKRWKKYYLFSINILMLLVLSFLWFFSGGMEGLTILYIFENFFVLFFLLNKDNRKRNASIIIHVAIFAALAFSEVIVPSWILGKDSPINIFVWVYLFDGFVAFGMATMFMIMERKQINNYFDSFLHRISKLEIENRFDRLTGCLDKIAFEVLLDEHKFAIERRGGSSCLAFIDIDYFKKINDTYGHLAGDGILRSVSGFLSDKLRKDDYIGRYGGEEFVILLTKTNAKDAFRIMNRIREDLSHHQWSLDSIPDSIAVTVSIGITRIDEETKNLTVTELMSKADSAMYKAKALGRNRVVTN